MRPFGAIVLAGTLLVLAGCVHSKNVPDAQEDLDEQSAAIVPFNGHPTTTNGPSTQVRQTMDAAEPTPTEESEWTSGAPPKPSLALFRDGVGIPTVSPLPIGRTPAIFDVNHDDLFSLYGYTTDTNGFVGENQNTGLESPTRGRDVRMADLDGDGCEDAVLNAYEDANQPLGRDYLSGFQSRILYQQSKDGKCTGLFSPGSGKDWVSLSSCRGRGETIVAADFNGDGWVDLFLPVYEYLEVDSTGWNNAQSCLVINAGNGNPHPYTRLKEAHLDWRRGSVHHRPEGAQAVDYDKDGKVDLYYNGILYHNDGNKVSGSIQDPQFRPAFAFLENGQVVNPADCPGGPDRCDTIFDEGAKFIDWDNSGNLSLVLMAIKPDQSQLGEGPRLFVYDGVHFKEEATAFPNATYDRTNGLNAYDINNDGYDDVVTPSGGDGVLRPDGSLGPCDSRLWLGQGRGLQFVAGSMPPSFSQACSDLMTFADTNGDGRIDLIIRNPKCIAGKRCGAENDSVLWHFVRFENANALKSMTIDVRDGDMRRTQFGHVVQVTADQHPERVFTKVIDGGSGYMSQTQYPIIVGTPYSDESHRVSVFYRDKTVRFKLRPDQRAIVSPNSPTVTVCNQRRSLKTRSLLGCKPQAVEP